MPQALHFLSLLGVASLAAAQGWLSYDPLNHFINPPTPVQAEDFGAAVNISLAGGGATFTWVTNLDIIQLTIIQEGNGYLPILIGPYSGNSYTWNGSTSDLGPDGGAWPNFEAYGNTFWLGIYEYPTNDSTPPTCFSRYFHLIDQDADPSSATTASASASPTSVSTDFQSQIATASPTNSSAVQTPTSSAASSSGSVSSSNSGSDNSKLVAIGAGVGVGIGVPLLIAIGVIIWLLGRKKGRDSAGVISQHQPNMVEPDSRHQLHGESAYGFRPTSHPAELPSSMMGSPTYKNDMNGNMST